MSQGEACQKHGREWWFVVARKVNYSAFNGYRATYSDYSEIRCGHPGGDGHRTSGVQYAGARWRTKAAYVDSLPDEKDWQPPSYSKVPSIAGGHTDVWQCQYQTCGAFVRGEAGKESHDRAFHPTRLEASDA